MKEVTLFFLPLYSNMFDWAKTAPRQLNHLQNKRLTYNFWKQIEIELEIDFLKNVRDWVRIEFLETDWDWVRDWVFEKR